MIELREQLQAILGTSYRIERELGGGGMSRVFLAEEGRLGRRVVIKVLPPETSAGVHADRFEREIQVAASLQHPHVVSLLTAGAAEDLLYYVMPFIDGESLATRIAREGALPVGEVCRILRDVVDALAYAHSRGVVHRDIKPDNILFAGRHALVADFGVAKAVSVSSGPRQTALTSTGVALGTPAYMAPEQAAADPNVDHRADLYAVGAVAYELLTGRTPFVTSSAQSMLAAHVSAIPDSVALHRPSIPPEVAALVMRCLEKHPADRWQSAAELLGRLEALATPSSGSTPVATTPVAAVRTSAETAIRRAHPGRVAALFLLASVAVTAIVYGATRVFALPDWVWILALVCMLAGLPVMLYTGRLERKRAQLRATGAFRYEPEPAHHQLFTWRRAFIGGAVALGGLLVLTGGYAASKAFGIGPGSTLLSSGAIGSADRFVLADFAGRGTEGSLAASVTEALRVDLGQSRVVKLVDTRAVSAALGRMGRAAGAPLDEAAAREVAVREGAKAVVVGDISSLGSGFVLTARIVTADSGTTLVPVRATANSPADLIAAVNRLSADLRERIGESLSAIRASEPLEQVSTASLPALQLYTRAARVFEQGDLPQARELLERSVQMDTSFAMAWRKLAVTLGNMGTSQTRQIEAARAAFRHRDRLPPLERHLTTAYYYNQADLKPDSVIAAYRAALDFDPEDKTASNNLGLVLTEEGRYAEAEAVLRRGLVSGGLMNQVNNLLDALIEQSKWAAAESLLTVAAERFPAHPAREMMPVVIARGRRDNAAVDSLLADTAALGRAQALMWRELAFTRGTQMVIKGRFRDADAASSKVAAQLLGVGDRQAAAAVTLLPAFWMAFQRNRPAEARTELAHARQRPEWRNLPATELPFATLGELHAWLGDVEAVRTARRAFEAARPPESRLPGEADWWDGYEAQAEGRWSDAAPAYSRAASERHCSPCGKFAAAHAWDRAGRADSAEALYRRGVERPVTANDGENAMYYPLALRRLGEMAEQRGDRTAALGYYERFVDLWRTADPDVQPQVAAVRQRITALSAEPRPRQ